MEALTPTYTSQTYHSKYNNYKEASKVLICNSSYDTWELDGCGNFIKTST